METRHQEREDAGHGAAAAAAAGATPPSAMAAGAGFKTVGPSASDAVAAAAVRLPESNDPQQQQHQQPQLLRDDSTSDDTSDDSSDSSDNSAGNMGSMAVPAAAAAAAAKVMPAPGSIFPRHRQHYTPDGGRLPAFFFGLPGVVHQPGRTFANHSGISRPRGYAGYSHAVPAAAAARGPFQHAHGVQMTGSRNLADSSTNSWPATGGAAAAAAGTDALPLFIPVAATGRHGSGASDCSAQIQHYIPGAGATAAGDGDGCRAGSGSASGSPDKPLQCSPGSTVSNGIQQQPLMGQQQYLAMDSYSRVVVDPLSSAVTVYPRTKRRRWLDPAAQQHPSGHLLPPDGVLSQGTQSSSLRQAAQQQQQQQPVLQHAPPHLPSGPVVMQQQGQQQSNNATNTAASGGGSRVFHRALPPEQSQMQHMQQQQSAAAGGAAVEHADGQGRVTPEQQPAGSGNFGQQQLLERGNSIALRRPQRQIKRTAAAAAMHFTAAAASSDEDEDTRPQSSIGGRKGSNTTGAGRTEAGKGSAGQQAGAGSGDDDWEEVSGSEVDSEDDEELGSELNSVSADEELAAAAARRSSRQGARKPAKGKAAAKGGQCGSRVCCQSRAAHVGLLVSSYLWAELMGCSSGTAGCSYPAQRVSVACIVYVPCQALVAPWIVASQASSRIGWVGRFLALRLYSQS